MAKSKKKTAAFLTLGCKLNQYESMGIEESLENAGYRIVSRFQGADYYIVNTCTVTGKTDRRSRHAVRRILKWNPHAKIVVTGCGAQRDASEFRDLPNVILIAGNREKNRIVDLITEAERKSELLEQIDPIESAPFMNIAISRFRNYTRAFVKIQEGCNHACTYCIIPGVRGRSRSQDPLEVLSEIRKLAESGFREIVLTGVDLGTYGMDLSPPLRLRDLLENLVDIPGLNRVRLSSIEPMEFTPDLIAFITSCKKICPHFHIPLQSGSDGILRRMDRTYTTSQFRTIVEALRTGSPDACIGADVITAFPGETDTQFQETHEFISSLPLDYLHVFTYSTRPGTPAADYPHQIAPPVAKERCHQLREISQVKSTDFRIRQLNTIRPVITLTSRDKLSGLPVALSDNYIRIQCRGSVPDPGEIIPVTIETVDGLNVFGRVSDQ